MGIRAEMGLLETLTKRQAPKHRGSLWTTSLAHHLKKDTSGNTWLITLILCEDGMDLVREEFCSCEETGKNL